MISRILICLIGLLLFQLSKSALNVDSAIVVMRVIEPFVTASKDGYTLDLARSVLEDAYDLTADDISYLVFEGDNNELVQNVSMYANYTNSTVVLGAAATTILSSREEDVDFLPTFFVSGLQIMVRSSVETWDWVSAFLGTVVSTFGLMIVAVLLVINATAPIIWIAESVTTDKPSIFTPPPSEERLEWYEESRIEIIMAYYWTASLVTGTDVGEPNSKIGKFFFITLGAFRILLVIISTAFMAAIFSVQASDTDINSYEDLDGNVVCANSGSSAYAFLDENNVGFTLEGKNSVDHLLESLLDDQSCDAVVYDHPILSYSLYQRELNNENSHAFLVGSPFKDERYGMFIAKESPHYEDLSQALITNLNDASYIEGLKEAWIEIGGDEDEETERGSISGLPSAVFYTPILIAVGVYLMGAIYMYKFLENRGHRERKVFVVVKLDYLVIFPFF